MKYMKTIRKASIHLASCITCILLLVAGFSKATVHVVDDLGDNSPIGGGQTLRQAVNNASNGDTIIIQVSGTCVLDGTPIEINGKAVTIIGPEAAHYTLDGNNNSGVLAFDYNMPSDTSHLYGVTIQGADNAAGAIQVSSGTSLAVYNSNISNNSVRGIFNDGGAISIFGSSIALNVNPTDGGGLYQNSGTLLLVNSTFGNNTAGGHGGGIYILNGSAHVLWCTFTQNTASGSGGGIQNFGGSVSMQNTVVTSNNAGTGNSELNAGGSGNYASFGFNLIKEDGGPMAGITGDIISNLSNPGLATLSAVNGWGILYYPIIDQGSDLIDAGQDPGGYPVDIRQAPRVLQGDAAGGFVPDIGAVEYSPFCVNSSNGNDLNAVMNAAISSGFTPPYYICFDVAGPGPHSLPLTSIYNLSNQFIIDGYSQTGSIIPGPTVPGGTWYSPADLAIEIDVSGQAYAFLFMNASTEQSEVRGLRMINYADYALRAEDDEIHIWGNEVGFDGSGNPAGGDYGLVIGGAGGSVGSKCLIGGTEFMHVNVIGGNSLANVLINEFAGTGNQIYQNLIGCLPNFSGPISGAASNVKGVEILGGGQTKIGGADFHEGNVISGQGYGVLWNASMSLEDTCAGNYIGIGPGNNTAFQNDKEGIRILNGTVNVVIGGPSFSHRNIISNNQSHGIQVEGASTSNITIVNNFIGVGDGGTLPFANGADGIYISNGASAVQIGDVDDGNVISGNDGNGITLTGSGTSNNKILSNIIGLASDGLTDIGNSGHGVLIISGATLVDVGANNDGNLISGNNQAGIEVNNAGQVIIVSNLIGTDITGLVARPNNRGIDLSNATTVDIGGIGTGEGNLISGNSSSGIFMLNNNFNIEVMGNWIGLDSTGLAALPNTGSGIYANDVTNLEVGDGTAAGRNFISGNSGHGITCTGAGVSNSAMLSNIIGLGIDGNTAIGNNSDGITLDNCDNVFVGQNGMLPQIISGNGLDGIGFSINNHSVFVQNNIVGLNAASTAFRSNSQKGINFSGQSSAIAIGGATAGDGNVIVGNGEDGIAVINTACDSIVILGNEIHSNGGNDATHLPIDLWGGNGVDPNDGLLDADGGANGLPNFPVLSTATAACSGSTTTAIRGHLEAKAGTTYRIEFFTIDVSRVEPSEHGGGEDYLGYVNVTTDATGLAAIAYNHPAVLNGVIDRVSATATEISPTNQLLRTSEFARSVPIVENPFNLVMGSFDETCVGDHDGMVFLISADGGAGTPTYLWNEGTANDSLVGLDPADSPFTLTITDTNGCSNSSSAITIAAATPIVFGTNVVNVSCFGNSSGSITFTGVSGGAGSYSYSIDGGLSFVASPTFTMLSAGVYNCVVQDVNGCTESTSVTITQPSSALTVSPTWVNVSCFGATDGTVSANPSGGTPGYTYSWSPGGHMTNTVTNLSAGTYTVTVLDANNCQTTGSATVGTPAEVITNTTITNATCNQNNGAFTAVATGGTGSGYEYSFNGSAFMSGGTFTGVAPGTYPLSSRDGNGCTENTTVTIAAVPTPSWLNLQLFDPTCNGGSNGEIVANVTPTNLLAAFPYQLNGSAGVVGNAFTGLTAGSYTITVTDTNNCTLDTTVILVDPPALTASDSIINNLCADSCNGELWLTPVGGSSPYSYTLNGAIGGGPTYTGLCEGNFVWVVQDNNGCQVSDTFDLIDPAPEDGSFTYAQSAYCLGAGIIVPSTPPTAGGSFSSSGGANIDLDAASGAIDLSNTNAAGTFDITYTTPCGIEHTEQITFNASPSFAIGGGGTYCSGTPVPDVFVVMTSGTGPYTFDLYLNGFLSQLGVTSNSDTFFFSGLTPGGYEVTNFVDFNGCVDSAIYGPVPLVEVPSPPAPSLIQTAYSYCPGEVIQPITAQGTGNGAIDWYDDAALTNSIFSGPNFAPGTSSGTDFFYVTETINGCVSPASSVSVTVFNAASVDAGEDVEICWGDSVELNATGGVIYEWNTDPTLSDSSIANPWASPDSTTTYPVLITNSDGCSFLDSVTVTVVTDGDCNFYVYNAFSPNGDGANETWQIKGIESYPENKVTIYNRWGDQLIEFQNYDNLGVVWDGSAATEAALPTGTYFYVIELAGEEQVFNGWVFLAK